MKKNNLISNIFFNTIYEILLVISPLITAPYISRVLQVDAVGINSYVSSLVSYFTMFASLGTYAYATREIAQNRNDKKAISQLFWDIELLTLLTSLLCLLIWIIITFCYKEYTIYLLIYGISIVSCFFDIAWLYAGLEKFKYTIIINAIVKIIAIVLTFVFVKNPDDLIFYMLITVGGLFLGNVSMWCFLPKFVSFSKPNFKNVLQHGKKTLIYFLPTIGATLYTSIDKTLIGLITQSNFENGIYEEATKIISIVKSGFILSVVNVISPNMSYLFKQNQEAQIKEQLKTTINILLTLCIGATFGIISVSQLFVPLFFGDGYDQVILVLYFLSPILIVLTLTKALDSLYFVPSGNIKKVAICLIMGSLVNLILNCCTIPFWGAIGASISSVLAEISILIFFLFNCKNILNILDILKLTWKKLIAGAVMFLCLFFLNKININNIVLLILEVCVGILVYFIVLLLLRDSFFQKIKNFITNIFKSKQTKENQNN